MLYGLELTRMCLRQVQAVLEILKAILVLGDDRILYGQVEHRFRFTLDPSLLML